MWADNETAVDFLNFTGVADTVAEIIVQTEGHPISIGVSGAWGVGKSSMIKLIRSSLERRDQPGGVKAKYLFVEFNAWLYQGYDDVRAALLEIIANRLKQEAERRKTGIEKATELLARVDWLRLGKLTVGTAASLAFGMPPVGLLGNLWNFGKSFATGQMDAKTAEGAEETYEKTTAAVGGLWKAKPDSSPPKEIHAIRGCFEETLQALGVTLVVLIDDLDRCLPETTITALEAIRLFLFLDRTAFVIAADNEMIRHAVRRHFEGVDAKHVTSYFDKLIQVPISVPPLGTQEVRAYMMLLFVETSSLTKEKKDLIRGKVCEQLGNSWQGKRVDHAFLRSLGVDLPSDLVARLDAAERLAPIMATAAQIEGNPRLIKRFMNALAIRKTIAHAHGISVEETILAKLLLLERCGPPEAFKELVLKINQDAEGKPHFLGAWEVKAKAGEEFSLQKPWDDAFVREWLTVPPAFADKDLRGALYVSREHTPLITPEDRLSSTGAELLTALLEHPDMAADLVTRLGTLQRAELAVIFDRVLERAEQVQQWGTPPILDACLAVARADPTLGSRLSAFLEKRPVQQLTPSIVPKLSSASWASGTCPGDIRTRRARLPPRCHPGVGPDRGQRLLPQGGQTRAGGVGRVPES